MLQVTVAVRKRGYSRCSSQGHQAQVTNFPTVIKGKFTCSDISYIKPPCPLPKKEVPTANSGKVPIWE